MILYEQHREDDDLEFDVRERLQITLLNWFDGNILSFLNWLKANTGNLSLFLADFFSIPFLERLYLIMDNYETVVLTKARICRWISENFDKPSYLQIGERLERDLRVMKIRGVIDDSRIFVDELRFTQWCAENLTSKAIQFSIRHHHQKAFPKRVDVKDIESSDEDVFRIRHHVGSEYMLYVMFIEAFKEFCRNRNFGIESYLGRRIRHGKLEGHMWADLQALASRNHYRPLFENPEFREFWELWSERFYGRVMKLRNVNLQFHDGKNREGWLSDELLSSQPRKEILIRFGWKGVEGLRSGLNPHDIINQMSDFCWSALQTDLFSIQKYLKSSEKNSALAELQSCFGRIRTPSTRERRFKRELQLAIAGKYDELASWFDRPSTVALAVAITDLIEAVDEEVASRFPGFAGKVDIAFEGKPDLTVYGSIYHHLYDCLEVLLTNARKHGHEQGSILVKLISESINGKSGIRVQVTSEFSDFRQRSKDIEKIEAAMKNPEVETAMVEEDATGIRKLRNIIITCFDQGLLNVIFTEKQVSFSFFAPVIMLDE
ncbi:MAG: hypothetical protein AAF391_08450 [Bacteroidota bacterium]